MKTAVFFISVLLFSAGVPTYAKPAVFYVAPSGSDSHSGTTAKTAFRTLPAARDAARAFHKTHPAETVRLSLLPGVYPLSEPLRLDGRDNNTIFGGAGKAILSGGTPITGWKNVGGNRWQTTVPGVAEGKRYFSQLFVNGERRYRPCLPKKGYYFIESALPAVEKPMLGGTAKGYDAFRFKTGDIRADWHDRSRVEVLPFHTWEMSRFPIEAIDPATNTVKFAGRTIGDQEFTNLAKGNRYLVENVREALSEPGEWYLDGETGVLTYRAKPGEDLRKVPVVAPRLESLLEVAGAKNIAFEQIQFAHTAYNAPKEGHSTWQAESDIPAALTIRGSQSIRLHKCAILHTGGYGLWIRAGSTKCDVWSSVLADLGAGGIKIGETDAPKTEADWVGLNAVRNCRILGGGRLHPAGIGVWIGQSGSNSIADNEIADFYYTGVSVGWNWGYGTVAARQNMVTGNHIHHIGQGVLSDMGGVYTLGGSDDTLIVENHIHDIRSFSYGGWGIYFDEGTTNVGASSNVVYNVSASPFHQHYGKDNRVAFNIFAFGDEAQLIRTRDEEHLSFTANHNVIVYSGDTLFGGNWNGDAKRAELSNNLYFRLGGKPVVFPGNRTLAQWQAATGRDTESRVADPGFVNPLKGDFRIKPDSFLNEHDMGGMGDKITTALSPITLSKLPIPRITPAFFPYVPPRLVSIRETFEEQAVGTVPQSPTLQVITEPDTPAAGVTVTEESSSGGRAIRVTDAPGQKASYNPHLFWQPRFDKGTVSASFLLRWQSGASLSHEWRTYANGAYQTGPNIAVDAKGTLTASGKIIATLPDNRWVVLTITCGVGEKANGTYSMVLSYRDASEMTIAKDLPNRDGKRFDRLDWWGFVADGTDDGVFDLDDISLKTR